MAPPGRIDKALVARRLAAMDSVPPREKRLLALNAEGIPLYGLDRVRLAAAKRRARRLLAAVEEA